MRIIGLTKDGHVGQQLKQLLSENWMIALVADRDLTGRGIEVEMFGATRRVPAGPALLSLTLGCAARRRAPSTRATTGGRFGSARRSRSSGPA